MEPEGGLLERQDVTASAGDLVSRVAAGGAGALFVVGEAGQGKTSVISLAGRLAGEAGLAVGLGRGHPMETSLPFGVMIEVLEAAGGRGLLGEGQLEPAAAGDRAARFYGVLRWLQDRADGALLLAVDDLHWADADSLALVSFLCRRMGSLRAGLIASLRPWPAGALQVAAALEGEGCGSICQLAPLSEAAAGALIQARLGYHLDAGVRHRAFVLCAGNPLLLEQLAVAIGQGGQVPEAVGAGAAAFGQGVLLARFAGLPPAGMRCAQAASVLGTSFQPQIAALVAGLDDSEAGAAAEALGRTGLIRQQPGAPAEFVHPLFCQALYDDLPGPARARLHARAFATLHARSLDAQAAEHAVQAGLAGDLEAAAVLEETGRAARRAGAIATAVTWLDAAVTMAGDQAGLGLLLARAEALLVAGQLDRAIPAYQQLLARPALPVNAQVEALWMLGRALVMTGDHDRAAAIFDQAASTAQAGDPGTAVQVLLDASFSAMISAGPGRALPVASRARDLAAALGGELRTRADALWGEVAVQTGDPAGIAAAEAAAPWLRPGHASGPFGPLADPGAWGTVNSFAFAVGLVERLAESERAFATLRASADRASLPEAIGILADGHGYVLTRMGRLDEALEAINVALSLTDLAPVIGSFAGVGRAYIQLYRGELDDSAQWCQRVEAAATARGEWNALLFVWDVLGHRRLREGAAAQACEHYARLEAMVHRMGIGEPCLPPWARHGIGAYVAAGRTGDAERILAWLDQAAQRLPCRFPRIAAATGRAWLAERRGDQAAAEEYHRAALALHDGVDLLFDQAETLLAYGAFLRRSGRPADARPVLVQAIEVAEASGARWLAGLARQELKVAGGRLRRRSDPAVLSAQEERVAALAAAGVANADIARQLYLSVSTVETHLEHIYAKLRIHTRYELIAKAADASWGTKTPGSPPDAR
jgi:DNA-binding CsgD family transcriptional regulator